VSVGWILGSHLSPLSFSQLKNGTGLTLFRGGTESIFKSFGRVLTLLFGIYSSVQKPGAPEPRIILESSFQSGNYSETIRSALRWSCPVRNWSALFPSSQEEPWKNIVPRLVLAKSLAPDWARKGKTPVLLLVEIQLFTLFSREVIKTSFLTGATATGLS